MILSALGLAVLVGCNDSTKPSTIAGHWVGVFIPSAPVTIDIKLWVTGDTLDGNGTISGGRLFTPLTVTGFYDEPDVTLDLTITGYDPVTITGTCNAAETRITATISGSGFTGQALTLDKQ